MTRTVHPTQFTAWHVRDTDGVYLASFDDKSLANEFAAAPELLEERGHFLYLVCEIVRIERGYGLTMQDPKGISVWEDRLAKLQKVSDEAITKTTT